MLLMFVWMYIKNVFLGVVSSAEGLELPIPRRDLGTIRAS